MASSCLHEIIFTRTTIRCQFKFNLIVILFQSDIFRKKLNVCQPFDLAVSNAQGGVLCCSLGLLELPICLGQGMVLGESGFVGRKCAPLMSCKILLATEDPEITGYPQKTSTTEQPPKTGFPTIPCSITMQPQNHHATTMHSPTSWSSSHAIWPSQTAWDLR